LPHAPGRNGWRSNLFTEVLDVPTICYWDHAPLELADQLQLPHPSSPPESQTGALEALRRTLANERVIHWSRVPNLFCTISNFSIQDRTLPSHNLQSA